MSSKQRRPKSIYLQNLRLLAALALALGAAWGCSGAQQREAGPVFFPPAPEPPRIQYLTSIRSNDDIGDKQSSLTSLILGKPEILKVIAKPFGVAAHDGVIYVADGAQSTILTLDLKNSKFDYIHDDRSWKSKLKSPVGLFIEPDGTKYVADTGRRQVVILNPDNSLKMVIGDGKDMRPIDVAVSGDRVYVCDIDHVAVKVFAKADGKPLFEFGAPGNKEGEFHKPTYLAVDSQGSIYVTDLLNFRVQKFDRDGKYIASFGEAGDSLGSFARPRGVAVDREGHTYVLDAAFENAQIFDQKGQLLMFFGGPGRNPGQMYLPVKVFIDYDHVQYFQRYVDKGFEVKYLIFVTNQLGDYPLSVYGFGQAKE